jgi:organic hydroperoxide reductase OsmC/OhrA
VSDPPEAICQPCWLTKPKAQFHTSAPDLKLGRRLNAQRYVVLISATVKNSSSSHTVEVCTGSAVQSLAVPSKPVGRGSAVNGGEFLMLALATCYCNDLFREAARLGIPVEEVEIEANAEFPGIGLAATNIRYRARVRSPASEADIATLLRETDAVAEVQNTVRAGVPIELLPPST